MAKWGMVIDLDCCTGCQTCMVACMCENNIPYAGKEDLEKGRRTAWLTYVKRDEGEFPYVKRTFIPLACQHCNNSPCTKVCPVRATYKTAEGITMQNPNRCIGCRLCMNACPYGTRKFNWFEARIRFIEPLDKAINPDVPLRPLGVVEKCIFCIHRIIKARINTKENKSSPMLDYMDVKEDCNLCHEYPSKTHPTENIEYRYTPVPACVQACPAGARHFGDLEDPESDVSKLIRNKRAYRLLEELGTEPSVYYLREG